MAATENGGVVVSRTVRDVLLGSGHEFQGMGTRTLQGVQGDRELFRVQS